MNPLTLFCRHVHEHDVAAVVLRNQTVFGELGTDLARVGFFLVDLVHSHNDGDACRLSMVNSFDRLWHDAVVGSNYKDGDVGDLGAAGTHSCECFVTRSIDEGNRTLNAFMFDPHLVGANVLGDSPVLSVNHIGMTDRVEQFRLSMIDVTHDGDHRRTRKEMVDVVEFFRPKVDVEGFEEFAVFVLGRDNRYLVAEFSTQGLEGVLV